MSAPKIIAVDFDGTCVTHEYPHVGRDIDAAFVLKELVANGHKLVLWTMRSGKELCDAKDWFQIRGIPLWGVNCNPEQHSWTTSPKAYANLYIDDAALGVPLKERPGERPYVDWFEVRKILEEKGLI